MKNMKSIFCKYKVVYKFCFSKNSEYKLVEFNEKDFVFHADEKLGDIYEKLDDENLVDFINNLELSDGILKFSLVNVNSVNNVNEEKKYVLNLQKPNKQIWFSSPFSGPQRFEYYTDLSDKNNYWLNKHNKKELQKLIMDEVNEFLNKEKKSGIKI